MIKFHKLNNEWKKETIKQKKDLDAAIATVF
jgi:hypothetical protein